VDSTRTISAERVVKAPPSKIFDLLAEPSRHAEIDGSGTVQGAPGAPRLTKVGDVFGMKMKMVVPYASSCEVSELEPDRRIAWRPVMKVAGVPVLGGQTWRYELEPVEGGTRVRETYDWGTARFSAALGLLGFPQRTAPALERTLERIAAIVEA
jgi:uncharacterized protein YndB with AHSA1/START domain